MRPELLYFVDPMCSWCWGFSPVIAQISERFGDALPIRVLLGGLAIGVDRPLSKSAKQEIATHWEHVRELTGQQFDHEFFEREDFVYNSELPCQAVAAIRNANLDSLHFLAKLQESFYKYNQDITQDVVLYDVAMASGFEPQSFMAQLHASATVEDTRKDFELTKKLGIQGFPALLGMADGRIELLTMGYEGYEPLAQKIEGWQDAVENAEQRT